MVTAEVCTGRSRWSPARRAGSARPPRSHWPRRAPRSRRGPPRRPARGAGRQIRGRRRDGAGGGRRHHRRGSGPGCRRAHGRRAGPARHPGQQRRRDAARPDRGRAGRRVAADGRAQRARACCTAPTPRSRTCCGRRGRARAGSPTWSTSARSPAGSPRNGSGVYNATKHGVGAFSESLRQEVTQRHVRVVAGRAGRGRDRAGRPQPARGPGGDAAAVRRRWSGWRPRTSPTRSATS